MTLKEFAALGGKARSRQLSAARRKEIAMLGVKARQAKRKLTARTLSKSGVKNKLKYFTNLLASKL